GGRYAPEALRGTMSVSSFGPGLFSTRLTTSPRSRRHSPQGETVMQFLLMCCNDESRWEAIPEPQRKKTMEEYGTFVEYLKKGGHYVAGAKLDRSSHAVTVRRKNGRLAITDGPFTETKEQLGGYHVVECKDREEAIALAMQIPTPEVGGIVEVRAIVPVVYG